MKSNNRSSGEPDVVLVGLCAHGLDIIQSLSRRGLRVLAVDTDLSLPGACTRLARVCRIPHKSGPELVSALRRLAESEEWATPPVLLLTNDNMVISVAKGWPELSGLFRLSWAESRQHMEALLMKQNLSEICAATGLLYPESVLLESPGNLANLPIGYPVIIKPVRPQSSFKAELVRSVEKASALLRSHPEAMPVIAQQWIDGPVDKLLFCALYLRDGEVCASFCGRKLASLPPAMGATCVAEPISNPELLRQTIAFFSGLNLSGPVSMEFKEAPDGRLWVIEPTAFRTDYWYGCCAANDVDILWHEYLHAVGEDSQPTPQRDSVLWADWERDPWSAVRETSRALVRTKGSAKVRWTYLDARDPAPTAALLVRLVARKIRNALRLSDARSGDALQL